LRNNDAPRLLKQAKAAQIVALQNGYRCLAKAFKSLAQSLHCSDAGASPEHVETCAQGRTYIVPATS
jgi:hypothetical protein